MEPCACSGINNSKSMLSQDKFHTFPETLKNKSTTPSTTTENIKNNLQQIRQNSPEEDRRHYKTTDKCSDYRNVGVKCRSESSLILQPEESSNFSSYSNTTCNRRNEEKFHMQRRVLAVNDIYKKRTNFSFNLDTTCHTQTDLTMSCLNTGRRQNYNGDRRNLYLGKQANGDEDITPDIYRRIFGPTPDESILAALQLLVDTCSRSDMFNEIVKTVEKQATRYECWCGTVKKPTTSTSTSQIVQSNAS